MFFKAGVPQLSRAHFAIKTGCGHIGVYPYLIQKQCVPWHTWHLFCVNITLGCYDMASVYFNKVSGTSSLQGTQNRICLPS